MKKVKKVILYAVIVIAVISGIVVAKNKFFSAEETTTTAVEIKKTAVEAQIVKRTEKNSGDTYKATLEAYQQGIVTSKLSARVASVSFENGQYVNAGDVLVTLEDQDTRNNLKTAQAQLQVNEQQLNSAQVSIEKLKNNLDDVKRTYDREKTLFESEAISKVDFETAEKNLNNAQVDYDSGNATVETSKASIEAQKINISNLQDTLNDAVIKAPISGVISGKSVNIGQMATPGTVLGKINDISSVYAIIQVPQEKISGLSIGQPATISVDGSDKTYNGTIQTMDSAADTITRVFNCKIKIDNSDKSLLPGIFGKVQLISEQNTEVITVPINALVGSEGNYSVFINNNGIAKKQKITIGETDDNNVEIISGINDGDQVICTNTSTLQDGTEVDIIMKEDNSIDNTASQKDGIVEDAAAKQEGE
jgi:RND family efflux transporter MFP subunit